MNTSVVIPKFFHELLGEKQLKSELIFILMFTLFSTIIVTGLTSSYWLTLKWYQIIVLWLLFLDISGGVIANLSQGTNDFYSKSAKTRWVFIAIHVQPLILAVVMQSSMVVAISVWGYTMVSASVVNLMRERKNHRVLAGTLLATGLIGFMLSSVSLPAPIAILYILFMMKVIYSFAVNHTKVS